MSLTTIPSHIPTVHCWVHHISKMMMIWLPSPHQDERSKKHSSRNVVDSNNVGVLVCCSTTWHMHNLWSRTDASHVNKHQQPHPREEGQNNAPGLSALPTHHNNLLKGVFKQIQLDVWCQRVYHTANNNKSQKAHSSWWFPLCLERVACRQPLLPDLYRLWQLPHLLSQWLCGSTGTIGDIQHYWFCLGRADKKVVHSTKKDAAFSFKTILMEGHIGSNGVLKGFLQITGAVMSAFEGLAKWGFLFFLDFHSFFFGSITELCFYIFI